MFLDCCQLVQTMSSFIYSNLYHIKEWFVMTPTVGIGQKLVSIKLNSFDRPFFALIIKALQNIENVAIVMYCFVSLLTFISGFMA